MVRRDWTAAREKCDREGRCRYCKRVGRVEAAHVVGIRHDPSPIVSPHAIIPLCPGCHHQYDQGRDGLELLPLLTLAEQAHAVGLVGIMAALKRTTRIDLTNR